MPSFAARVVSGLLRATHANATFVDAAKARERIAERRVRPGSYAPQKNLPGVTITLDRPNGWPVYTILPENGNPSGVLVYAHGGAWVNEIVRQHWSLLAQIAAEADIAVVVPIYPLVPFGTSAEVVERFVALFLEARAKYGRAAIGGDSAGGQIALSAALDLLSEHRITPEQILLISPALDLSFGNPDIPAVQPHDPWLARPGGIVYAEAWRGDLPFDDPRVSPLFGDHTGLGPITMFSGTHDILNPDARVLARRLRQAGVDLSFYEGTRQVHVYPLLPTPEGKAARTTIAGLLRRSLRA